MNILINNMISQHPILDIENIFAFLSNNKVYQTSINRYFFNNIVFVYFIVYYESLGHNWKIISKICCSAKLPKKNKRKHLVYSKLYSLKYKDIVSHICKRY